MDRDLPQTEGVLTAKPNGRKSNIRPSATNLPVRRSLGNHEFKENGTTSDTDAPLRAIPRPTHTSTTKHRQSDSFAARPISSPSPTPSARSDRSSAILGTPGYESRIPRPKTTEPTTSIRSQAIRNNKDRSPASPMRHPLSITAAFRLAEKQTVMESNSDSENTGDFKQAFNMARAEYNVRGIDGSPSPAPRPFRRGLREPATSKLRGNTGLNEHLNRFDRAHSLASGSRPLGSLLSKDREGAKASQSDRIWNGQTSGDNKGDSPGRLLGNDPVGPLSREITKTGTRGQRLPAAGSGAGRVDADVPLASVEYEPINIAPPSPDRRHAMISPEKAMNWHFDEDFTAGDLQISASPRITVKKPSTDLSHRLSHVNRARKETPGRGQSNDRLREILQREAEAEKANFAEDMSANKLINNRLDEISALESQAFSRKALASSRLDEIRMRNSEPRSESPENRKGPPTTPPKEEPPRPRSEHTTAPEIVSEVRQQDEPVHDTPVVVYKSTVDAPSGASRRETLPRGDSHDLLRRLARAASLSPDDKGEKDRQTKSAPANHHALDRFVGKEISEPQPPETLNPIRSPLREERRTRYLEIKDPRDRPTVGFADLVRKIPSDDSIQGKRSSKTTSEIDPTDRIQGELSLFAPLDNYSERGSKRAPSPVQSEPDDDKTPRPPKVDPLTMPTPRVTGAYVDTPATVRVKEERSHVEKPDLPVAGAAADFKAYQPTSSPTKRSLDALDTGRARSLRRSSIRSNSLPTGPRRPRSSSRRRRRLINTAKPPSVRDDILAILRANDIDDSTLENLDSILGDRGVDDGDLKKMVEDSVHKVEDDLDMKLSDITDRERELEAYDRMSKTLKTGLLGIRSAKKGIERLEDKVIHRDRKDDEPTSKAGTNKGKEQGSPAPSTKTDSIPLSIPKLYRTHPKFKLTPLGIITVLGLIWYAVESTFCFLYAGPEYICTPSVPCEWSPNEPYFPYTMPFMLDEWATGGKGRALAWRAGEEIGDMAAEVSDWVTKTDFTQSDPLYMTVWQRKRHFRRLHKHGLIPKWTPPDGYIPRYQEWQEARASAEEFGFDEEAETMWEDEVLR
ncbi:hypothetical protein GGS20DRAFT_554464 [Poronia punctata]|nr:hypothetical protein GGS20DRAFT_554464 [Poronia punctata]